MKCSSSGWKPVHARPSVSSEPNRLRRIAADRLNFFQVPSQNHIGEHRYSSIYESQDEIEGWPVQAILGFGAELPARKKPLSGMATWQGFYLFNLVAAGFDLATESAGDLSSVGDQSCDRSLRHSQANDTRLEDCVHMDQRVSPLR
jgi:hypothetical protein